MEVTLQVSVLKALISSVGIIMQCESKLSMAEVVGGLDGVVEPLEE